MKDLYCKKCKKEFKSKLGLKKHVDRGTCMNLDFACTYCNSRFARKSGLSYHINYSCKKAKRERNKNKKMSEKEDVEELKRINEELRKENEKLKEEKQINIQQVNNINNIHLHINPHGRESLENVNMPKLLRLINNLNKQGNNQLILPNMFRIINMEQKENRNVYVPNIRGEYALALENKEWKPMKMDELFNDILITNMYRLEDFIDYRKDEFIKVIGINQYNELKHNLKNYMDNISQKEKEECMNRIKDILIKHRTLVSTLYLELTGQKISMPK